MGQAGVLVGPTQASGRAACGAIGQRPPSPRLSQGGWGRLEGTRGREVGGGEEPGDHKLLSLLAQECHVDVAQDQAQIQSGGGEVAFSPKPTAATHTRDRTATSCQPRRVPSPTPSKLLSSESHSPVPRGSTYTGPCMFACKPQAGAHSGSEAGLQPRRGYRAQHGTEARLPLPAPRAPPSPIPRGSPPPNLQAGDIFPAASPPSSLHAPPPRPPLPTALGTSLHCTLSLPVVSPSTGPTSQQAAKLTSFLCTNSHTQTEATPQPSR